MSKILFVCTGNICRSPTADGILRHLVHAAQLEKKISVDSAGTRAYHVGEPPDHRTIEHAKRRGFDLAPLRARQVCAQDFIEFDYLLAMDRGHLKELQQLCPTEYQHKLKLMLSYSSRYLNQDVPDPYYQGPAAFELVLDQLEESCKILLKHIQGEL